MLCRRWQSSALIPRSLLASSPAAGADLPAGCRATTASSQTSALTVVVADYDTVHIVATPALSVLCMSIRAIQIVTKGCFEGEPAFNIRTYVTYGIPAAVLCHYLSVS